MDDVIETGASAAPTSDTGAASAAPTESSPAPEKPSRFAALMADDSDSGEDQADEAETDGDGIDSAEGDEPEADSPEGEPPPKEEPALDEEDVPKDLKSILRKNPELRAAHFYKRDMDSLGISVEEAKEYRENIPSLDDLKMTVDRAKALDAFEGLFTHPDPGAPEQFLEGLRTVNAQSADRFVKYVAQKLPQVAPEAYYALGADVWEKGMARIEKHAGDDPFRREAVQAVREMLDEILQAPASERVPEHRPLPSPDAEELARRRADEARARESFAVRLNNEANKAADKEVRALVADVVKRRDPHGLLTSPDVLEKIVHEVHRKVAAAGTVNQLFIQALNDSSLKPEDRVARAAGLVRARAKNLVDLAFRKETDGIAERLRKASQLKLGKAARVVSMREATGGRPASAPAPAPPRGRASARDIFRAVMKG